MEPVSCLQAHLSHDKSLQQRQHEQPAPSRLLPCLGNPAQCSIIAAAVCDMLWRAS